MVQWAAIWVQRGIHKWQANLHVGNATTQTTKNKERWVWFVFKFKTHQPHWRYFSKYFSFILIGSNPMANLSQPASVNQIWKTIRKNDDIVRKKKGTVTKNPVDKVALFGTFRGEETAEIMPKDIRRSARIHSVDDICYLENICSRAKHFFDSVVLLRKLTKRTPT